MNLFFVICYSIIQGPKLGWGRLGWPQIDQSERTQFLNQVKSGLLGPTLGQLGLQGKMFVSFWVRLIRFIWPYQFVPHLLQQKFNFTKFI